MAGKKRKATDADDSTSTKKRATAHSDAQALIKAVLAKPETYPILDDPDFVRRQLVELAQYARHLEEELHSSAQGGSAPKAMSPEQLQAAVEKLRKAANSGITKQMGWKPSCKDGSAKWSYDGVCTDPLVFGTLLGLGGPPTFKMRKIPVDDFDDLLGGIKASVRYDHLFITGKHVNVRWSDEGEFKFSGTYGKWQPKPAQ